MKLTQIENEIVYAADTYGRNGDQSLEYYGLVIKDGNCSSSKLYRRASYKSDEQSLTDKYRNLPFFQTIIKFARIYDFSLRHDENNVEYIRLVFAPFKNVLHSNKLFFKLLELCHIEKHATYFNTLIEYYHRTEFTGTSPLLKMGIEMCENGDILEAKAYFALKSFDDRYDHIGKRCLYSACRHLVDKSLSLLNMSDLSDYFAEVAEKMEMNQYYPIFTGVNFSDDYAEMKVYYETCFSCYKSEDIVRYENNLAKIMMLDISEIGEMHQRILSKDLFLDCVSHSVLRYYSASKKDIILWKPYYLQIDSSLIGTRTIDRPCFETTEIRSIDPERYKIVLLVDEDDRPIGFMEKQQAHLQGEMHRAFSIFLHDGKGNMLIQQRAACKYHSPLLLTNACCSHPLTSNVKEEAQSRLTEELGLYDIELTELFVFHYRSEVGEGLIENEMDHVLIGKCSDQPVLNTSEAIAQWYIPFAQLLDDTENHPEKYTVWFRLLVHRVIQKLKEEEDL